MNLLRFKYDEHSVIRLVAVLMLTGCQVSDIEHTAGELAPVAAIGSSAGQRNTAAAQVADVRAEVTSNVWPGAEAVTQQLTPLYIRIENHGDIPLLIQFRSFALIGPHQEYFAALPPLAASVDIGEFTGDGHEFAADDNWLFNHHGFFISPFYSGSYPALPVWSHGVLHDNKFRAAPHRTASHSPISAAELAARVLPEGVVEPQGSISGFLLFEYVAPDLAQVAFQGELIDATSGDAFGLLQIPFARKD